MCVLSVFSCWGQEEGASSVGACVCAGEDTIAFDEEKKKERPVVV